MQLYNLAFQQLLAEKQGVLPENVICDPTYNIGFQYHSYSDNLPESEYIEMLGGVKHAFKPLLRLQTKRTIQRFLHCEQ